MHAQLFFSETARRYVLSEISERATLYQRKQTIQREAEAKVKRERENPVVPRLFDFGGQKSVG